MKEIRKVGHDYHTEVKDYEYPPDKSQVRDEQPLTLMQKLRRATLIYFGLENNFMHRKLGKPNHNFVDNPYSQEKSHDPY